jgi:hypothetical protein
VLVGVVEMLSHLMAGPLLISDLRCSPLSLRLNSPLDMYRRRGTFSLVDPPTLPDAAAITFGGLSIKLLRSSQLDQADDSSQQGRPSEVRATMWIREGGCIDHQAQIMFLGLS